MIWNCQNVVECPDSFYCVCVHKLGLWCHFLGLYQKKERRHKSYKICIVDKSFIQLQFHEANILIVHFFGQLTKGIFYNLKIPTLSCFRRHKDLKLLLNLLAETSGVSQLFFLQLCLLVQKKMMIHLGRHLCLIISIPHNIPIWICSHPISMLSIYLSTWRQVCQSHFEFSPSLTKSFNPSGNHRLGQYVFASEYFDLHITSFWNNTFFRRICDLKNTRQWFQTKRKESIFQDCCKTII